jgi:hypothetical protein
MRDKSPGYGVILRARYSQNRVGFQVNKDAKEEGGEKGIQAAEPVVTTSVNIPLARDIR